MDQHITSIIQATKEVVAESERLLADAERVVAESKEQTKRFQWLVFNIQRPHQKNDQMPLQEAIRSLHRCRSQHVASFAVKKLSAGNTVWDGIVEEFRLIGHRRAKLCYAWLYVDWGKTHAFSILKQPPIDSPQRAVQMALAMRGECQAENWEKKVVDAVLSSGAC